MDVYQQLKSSALSALDLHRAAIDSYSDEQVREFLGRAVNEAAEQLGVYQQSQVMVERLLDDLLGLGPLEPLLREADVSEIMVNRFDTIFVERNGNLQPCAMTFSDEASVKRAIERIVTPLGRRIDESSPMVDARLPCGSRVNAIIPPLAIDGSCITIRKFSAKRLFLEDLIASGSCSRGMALLLETAVQARVNILISGGTGSGKTTLLNVLADSIAEHERVITIEDAAELSLAQANQVRLEARPANQEGEGQVSIRALMINALRMRPDRIIIGECRGGESLDMLQAMNTGHSGSMTTLHANRPRDAVRRLETMVLMAGMDLPLLAIRQQIVSAVQLIVQVSRTAGGHRRITSISEIQGLEGEVVQLAELWHWQELASCHRASGELPQFIEQLPESQRATIRAVIHSESSHAEFKLGELG